VFDELLYLLMSQWAEHGAQAADEAGRPPEHDGQIAVEDWAEYADRVAECEDREWRELVQVTQLMHDRIRHMVHQTSVYLDTIDEG
jgi:hypothetical protein